MAPAPTPSDRTPSDGSRPPDPRTATKQGVDRISRVVSPRKQYPLHYDFLMVDLARRREHPERWLVIAAEELRLDEDGMDVQFTLVEDGSNRVRRCRVDVQRGRLDRITYG